jgi:hypothetical protein
MRLSPFAMFPSVVFSAHSEQDGEAIATTTQSCGSSPHEKMFKRTGTVCLPKASENPRYPPLFWLTSILFFSSR